MSDINHNITSYFGIWRDYGIRVWWRIGDILALPQICLV